jgi:hypothetical protein
MEIKKFIFIRIRIFLVKKNMERWHKMKKFNRHIVAYEISDCFMLI